MNNEVVGHQALLPHLSARGYLNSASIGLPPSSVIASLQGALSDWQAGRTRAPAFDDDVDAARAAFARLVGVDRADVAVGNQVSVFVGLIASSLPRGSEVVCADQEFTSLLYPFLARADLNVRCVPLERISEALDARTAMVAVSAVQSADGRLADLAAIVAAAQHHGARTLVDATQAVGWLPIDARQVDFLVCGTYKWLLSPRGSAFLALRPERLFEIPPLFAGWYAGSQRWRTSLYGPPLQLATDARRLDLSPAWFTWVGTRAAIDEIQAVGVERIHRHNVALANHVRARLDLPASDSAIVSLEMTEGGARVHAAGIVASTRAGRLRLSFHLYNDQSDADAVVEALQPRRSSRGSVPAATRPTSETAG